MSNSEDKSLRVWDMSKRIGVQVGSRQRRRAECVAVAGSGGATSGRRLLQAQAAVEGRRLASSHLAKRCTPALPTPRHAPLRPSAASTTASGS